MSPLDAGIGQDKRNLVRDNIQQNETTNRSMKAELPVMRLKWVDSGQHDEKFKVENDWRSDEKEQRASEVGKCMR